MIIGKGAFKISENKTGYLYTDVLVEMNFSMFHQDSRMGGCGCTEMHRGDMWEYTQILGKFMGDRETSGYIIFFNIYKIQIHIQ